MTEPVPTPEPTPTQTVHPWKAALRTAVQVLTTLVLLWPALSAVLEDTALNLGWEWALPTIGAVTVLAAGLARVMAIPAVNAWLTKIGLGAQPAEAQHAKRA
jgi:hypothetical protein